MKSPGVVPLVLNPNPRTVGKQVVLHPKTSAHYAQNSHRKTRLLIHPSSFLLHPFKKYRLAIVMPLRIEPMMPTSPWSVPQMNRFRRCVVPS